ncbi:MAG: phytanoyl-CoA dioxygenase family protein [Pseudomonadales bacterium]
MNHAISNEYAGPSDVDSFRQLIDRNGWVVFDSVLDEQQCNDLIAAHDLATQACREIQIRNGVADGTAGTSHHLVVFEGAFLEFLEDLPLYPYLCAYFDGGPFILNSFGGVSNFRADSSSYVGKVHRDIRSWSGDLHLMMNMLVMLDDFTPENGATWLMPQSHRLAAQPADDEFFAVAEQAVAPRGSIVLFNSNLWHAAGKNTTPCTRRGLTPMFTKPFYKPQFDYCRFFGDRVTGFSPLVQQLLGYHARVPADLDEWYRKPESRMYRPDQG